MDILKRREFPDNYTNDVVNSINLMTYPGSEVQIVGTSALRSQQYAADTDVLNTVRSKEKTAKAAEYFAKGFQKIVENLQKANGVYIGDIKAGEVPDWNLISNSYNQSEAQEKLARLVEEGVVHPGTAREVFPLLKKKLTAKELTHLKDITRFGVLRWTPAEVLHGSKVAPKWSISLETALLLPSVVKIDIVTSGEGCKFYDIATVYQFFIKGKAVAPAATAEAGIRGDIEELLLEGNYAKVAKRLFSLARASDNKKAITSLNEFLNGDFGRLYSLLADTNILLFLLENAKSVPLAKIQHELDGFRQRLGSIYTVPSVETPDLLKELAKMTSLPKTAKGRDQLLTHLMAFRDAIEPRLQNFAKGGLEAYKLLPLPKWAK